MEISQTRHKTVRNFNGVTEPTAGAINDATILGWADRGNVAVDAHDCLARLACNPSRFRFLATFFGSQPKRFVAADRESSRKPE